MKNNQSGFAMVWVLLIMMVLTIMGVATLNTSRTEIQIATNMAIHQQTFYAAEGGMIQGSEWAVENNNTVWENTASDGVGTFTNGTSFDFNVEYWKNGGTNVINYIDPVSNLTLPELLITGTGQHIRGGETVVSGIWIMRPIFIMPETPLWVFDTIKAQGTVDVDAGPGRDEVAFTLTPMLPYSLPNKMNCPTNGCSYNTSPAPFPTDEIRERVKDGADYSGNVFPTDLISKSSLTNPIVVYINGDATLNDSSIVKNTSTGNEEGFGILFIDGSAKINGNIKWNGLIIIRDTAEIGNGTADIEGALIVGHNTTPGQPNDGIIDVSLSGNISVKYNRSLLMSLREKTQEPVMIAWFN